MKVLYQINYPETVYAARFIYDGYKSAFNDLGHKFRPYTATDGLEKILYEFNPHIFISSLNRYNLRFLNLKVLKKYRDRGLVFFNQLVPWKKVNNQFGGGDLESATDLVNLIKEGLAGDIFFYWMEQESLCMEGFTNETGYKFHTILLAADKNRYFYEFDKKYAADISFVGNYLPDKREFIRKHFFPLMRRYNVKAYGSDWTLADRLIGYIQKAGQYFKISQLKGIRKLKLPLEDERKVYSSSCISLNIHEEHQRETGADFNERTLKIPASGGFEICDYVSIIRKYFTEKEIVMAENTKDWFEKIDYFIRNPQERGKIIEASRKKILEKHTYHNRVKQIISIYNDFKS